MSRGRDDKVKTDDVFVLIPGIMGSVLTQKRGDGKKDRDIWSPSFGAIGRALRHRTKNLLALKLEHEPHTLEELEGDIVADRLMPDVHIIPRFWKIDGYGELASFVRERFTVTPGETFFEFPYDWRIDNRLNAQLFERSAQEWIAARRKKGFDSKLVILAHSMGGLVSRYFIEVLGGWRITRRLFTIATPHRGSLNVLDFMVNGYRPVFWGVKLPELALFTELVRSFTSAYQLMPIYPCYEEKAGTLRRASEIEGLEGLSRERIADGIAFHDEIRAGHQRNLRDEKYVRERYELHAIVGTHQETTQSVRAGVEGLEVLSSIHNEDLKGDGTVPYASALPLEMEEEQHDVRTLYVPEKHSRLQNAKQVHSQIEGTLTTAGVNLAGYRDLERGLPLSLDVPDAFLEDEEIHFRVRCEDDWVGLKATLFDAATDAEVERFELIESEEELWRAGRGNPLPTGTYRLEVTSQNPGEARPVSDVFTVL